jgi:hypothetical protein
VDVENPGDETVTFNVRVDDGPPVWAPKVEHVHTGTSTIAAHSKGTYFVDLLQTDNPLDKGMRCSPPSPARTGMTEMIGTGSVNTGHIIGYLLFVERPANPITLIVDNVRLLPSVPVNDRFAHLTDEYGQFAKLDWPGKIHSAGEMNASWSRERRELQASPALQERDEFGGWTGGPTLTATGSFRTELRDGRWWFVDPAGHLFLAQGVNGPVLANPTVVTGREDMFNWLPASTDPLSRHYSSVSGVFAGPVRVGKCFDYYTANLERKFGGDYVPAWREETVARLRGWGINSMSGWNLDLLPNNSVPYMKNMGVGSKHATIPMGGWGPMDDPWDPQFAADAATRFAQNAAPLDKDPLCIGIMVGNEMSWGRDDFSGNAKNHYRLALSTLSLSERSHAKRVFVEMLRAKYGDIAKLNAAWGSAVTDWDSLLTARYPQPATPSDQFQRDASAFLTAHATQWFRIVRDELKKAAPRKLFLGCRFAEFTPEAVAAAAEYSDVLSFNIYHVTKLPSPRWSFLRTLGKPIIVSEWHFGAPDRGLFGGGLGLVRDQTERAKAYASFANDLLDNPAVIGEQWFQYNDQPLTGRSFDGENYGIGLVTVTDQPYPELIRAVRDTNGAAYKRHAACTRL